MLTQIIEHYLFKLLSKPSDLTNITKFIKEAKKLNYNRELSLLNKLNQTTNIELIQDMILTYPIVLQ